MKTCRRCTKDKDLKNFGYNARKSDGLDIYCKSCRTEQSRARRTQNLAKVRQQARDSAARRKEQGHKKSHNPTAHKYSMMKFRYGLDRESYDALVDTFPFCYICDSQEKLVIDHCHTTGLVRGRICNRCNLGLGRFFDDPDLLEKALAYLQNPPARAILESEKNLEN